MPLRNLILIGALLAAPVTTLAADSEPLTVGLVWTRFPTDKAVAPYTPEVAAERGQPGWAVINCAVDGKGGLSDCQTVKESAPRLFFGAAAKRMADVGLFALAPQTAGGAPTAGARVRFPVVFRLVGLNLAPSGRLKAIPPVEG